MKKVLFITAILLGLNLAGKAQEPADWVDPFIGTTNFGTTNPGAICPNGMMSVTPFNVMGSDLNEYDKDSRWWSTPYEYTNCYFTGYAHVALSGVGCPEAASLLVMPTTGELDVDYHNYGSEYRDEKASPGYFSNILTKYGIRTEVTATTRSSCERYTFPAGKGNILLNLGQGLTNESGATVRRVSSTEIEGVKLLGTFCYNPGAVFPIYFVMRVDREPSSSGYWKKQPLFKGVEAEWTVDDGEYKLYKNYNRELSGDDIGFWFTYDNLDEGDQITVRMGVSFVSIENARENLDKEQHSRTFEQIHADARKEWNDNLNRIKVSGGTDEQKTIFYTALYHALIHPSILSDVNGEYPQMESGLTAKSDYTRYTIFSLWDTYRNLHQLMTLVYPERQIDMLRSMVGMYKEWGWLPRWELFGRETYTMDGDPAAIVIADSYIKGLRDFDIDAAYEGMIKSATT
ncbi:MAG: GH92 family glycosyl hydrolase, partial [Bacteroidaceae bacterium]|nr:GH92 family glycosyl hydrolase [Bacteroidaceae bacterium]